MFYLLIPLSLFFFIIPKEYIGMYNYLLKKNDNNHLSVIHQFIQFIFNYIYIYISQNIFHNTIVIHKHIYDIEYSINCKIYRFRTSYKKGPSKYSQFIDDQGNDISEDLFKYVGPNDDFHNIDYTPNDFDCSSITIIYSDDTHKTFQNNDILSKQYFTNLSSNDILSSHDTEFSDDIHSFGTNSSQIEPNYIDHTNPYIEPMNIIDRIDVVDPTDLLDPTDLSDHVELIEDNVELIEDDHVELIEDDHVKLIEDDHVELIEDDVFENKMEPNNILFKN